MIKNSAFNSCRKISNYYIPTHKGHAGAIIEIRLFVTKYVLVRGIDNDKWSFPAGHYEQDENDLETAVRECYEETGIDLKSIKNKFNFNADATAYYVWNLSSMPAMNPIDTDEIELVQAFTEEEINRLDTNSHVKKYFIFKNQRKI